ncbi:MAG: AAC(3) family N-acetyltransferase [Chloroflexi bacterium]|nr:AAC(3) family N-acetyltransferase [Chloroflexota bacterium]
MTTVRYRDIVRGLREVGLDGEGPVLVHASLSAFGEVEGGVSSLVGALTFLAGGVMAPAFTYRTMIIPEVGPPDNGLGYGSGAEQNSLAELWSPDLPADLAMGVVPETVRRLEGAARSGHPILSFTGVGAASEALAAQTLAEPLAPIAWLATRDGAVLLLGVDHARNTAIHLGERRAGRKGFTRWALTPAGVAACPGFPGCSDGFGAIAPRLAGISRQTEIGEALVRQIPIQPMLEIVESMIREDPLALLCERADCERCRAVRAQV